MNRILYKVPGCEPCSKLEEWIKGYENPVELDSTIELKKIDNEWFEPDNKGGYVKFNPEIHEFPALKIYDSFLLGFEGIKSYLEKGYLYESRQCPYLSSNCIEKKCEIFVMIKKGDIVEGGCAIKMNTLIALESLTKGK